VLLLAALVALTLAAPRLVGGGWLQSGGEVAVRAMGDFLVANGTRAQLPQLPLLLTLTLALATYNLSGLLPYGYTFSAHLVCTLFYAATAFFGLNYVAVARYGRSYFNLFLPAGTPLPLLPLLVLLEVVSYFSRPLSLAIRLFANMMAGHALLKILLAFGFRGLGGGAFPALASLLAFGLIGLILLMELMVALLQVFVFVTLVSLYLVDVHTPHHLWRPWRWRCCPWGRCSRPWRPWAPWWEPWCLWPPSPWWSGS
jgi:F-type H+-transporting ATPase subunit a